MVIESYIKKNEINKKYRKLEESYENVTTYWNIGKLLIEAQGGSDKSNYGDKLIKKWSMLFTNKYGRGYDVTALKRSRKLYLLFPMGAPAVHLSWSHYILLLPISDESKRNYYINLCLKNNLSKRDLEKEIKQKSYERLVNKTDKIDLITPAKKADLLDDMKNPIIIDNFKKKIKTESDLEMAIISSLKMFFRQLGEGYAFIDNQYKVVYENKSYFIDILLFNYKFNAFVVVELKLRELKREDKSQVQFYMNLIDDTLCESTHNKTFGIIISKSQDKFIANFVREDRLIPLTYEVL